MLTDGERALLMQEIERKRAQAIEVPISLEEEADFAVKLVKFMTRPNPADRCFAATGIHCEAVRPVLVCRGIVSSGGALALTGSVIVSQRYRCLSCGALILATIEREG